MILQKIHRAIRNGILTSPKPAVVVQLTGTLGSQMFQYATGLRLALDRKVPLALDIESSAQRYRYFAFALGEFAISGREVAASQVEAIKKGYGWAYPLRRGFGSRCPLGFRTIVEERSLAFDPSVLRVGPRVYIAGDWKNENYFRPIRERIRREFDVALEAQGRRPELLRDVSVADSIAIHIRRADYAHVQRGNWPLAWPPSCSTDYYAAAISRITALHPAGSLFLFTDDASWVAETCPAVAARCRIVVVDESAPADLCLMSRCSHHVISNTDFAWWAAWLSPREGKTVIAPRRWFPVTNRSTEHLLPRDWIQL